MSHPPWTRHQWARHVAQDIADGAVGNLGIGAVSAASTPTWPPSTSRRRACVIDIVDGLDRAELQRLTGVPLHAA
jgi:acyl CoA:acetate/3-ketoacid CoA transferase beta subunit